MAYRGAKTGALSPGLLKLSQIWFSSQIVGVFDCEHVKDEAVFNLHHDSCFVNKAGPPWVQVYAFSLLAFLFVSLEEVR